MQTGFLGEIILGNLLSNLIRFFSVAILLAGVTYGGLWLSQPEHFPITSVKIIGEYHRLSRDKLQDVVTQHLAAGFFGLDVKEIRHAVEAIPWVRFAYVRRVWPSQLVIQLEEQIAFARWNDQGIVTVNGDLITPPRETFPKDLPLLDGPLGRHRWVWEQYRVMSEILAASKRTIARLELAKRGSWTLILDNNIKVILGKAEVLARLRRFTQAYQRVLAASSEKVAYVDLRYTSGLAVGWKTERLLSGENRRDV